MSQKKIDTRELGLSASLILGAYFFKTEDLHYGYWPDDLEVAIENFTHAQKQHSDFIISHIPANVRSVLDVGCGAGTLAARLIENGYSVDCVSPSSVLTEKTKLKIGPESRIYETKFRYIDTKKRYDLLLFSESFQYVKLPHAIDKAREILNEGGHLLICDFFKTDAPGKSALSGGHRLSTFYSMMTEKPFKLVKDIDITEQTAPNLQLINEMLQQVGKPLWNLLFMTVERKYSLLSKFLKWKYKKKIDRINRRYFSGERNEDNFKIFKSYRLLLYAAE